MKQLWINWSHRIDALSLRERAMVFLAAAASIVFFVYFFMLNPLYLRQKILRAQISEQRSNIAAIDVDLTQKAKAYGADPDANNRIRLAALQAQVAQLGARLRGVQKGLVAPEKMVPVLEEILRGNGKLRLLSMKSLPVSGISEGAFTLPKSAKADPTANGASGADSPLAHINTAIANAAVEAKVDGKGPASKVEAVVKPPELLYRHGVEITLQGSYLDMVNYMATLEAMPSQLFWGGARLDVEQFPSARLTLTLYTLSLDKKWVKL